MSYQRYFYKLTEAEDCDCSTCPKAESCQKKKEKEMQETCPEESNPRGGKCARADNNGYLKNVCDKGYTWDKTHDECVKMSKS